LFVAIPFAGSPTIIGAAIPTFKLSIILLSLPLPLSDKAYAYIVVLVVT
jgi:hypothetical protein